MTPDPEAGYTLWQLILVIGTPVLIVAVALGLAYWLGGR